MSARYTARVEIYRTETPAPGTVRPSERGNIPGDKQTEITKFTIHAEGRDELARKIKAITNIELTEGD